MAERRRGRPRKSDTDVVAKMKQRWTQSRKLRERWQMDYQLEHLYAAVLGRGQPLALEQDDIRINRFLPTIEAMVPSLFFQNPTFRVLPKEKEATGDVLLQRSYGEAVLAEIATREFNLQNATKLALIQSFFSMGILKIVYDPRMHPNPRKGEPLMQTTAGGVPVRHPETNEPMPEIDLQTGEPILEPDEIMGDEVYRFEWVDADKMLLPDQGPDMSRWSWIGEEVTVTLQDAKDDTRFPARLREQFTVNGRSEDYGRTRERMFASDGPDDDGDFTYVEFWDIRQRKYYVMADGQPFSDSEFLLEDDYPAGVEDHPYAILPGYFPILGPDQCPWPLPRTYNWLSLQNEYETRRRQIIEAGKRIARKVYYDDSTFADEDQARAALQSPTDMEAVKINDTQRPPIAISDPDISASLFQDTALQQRDWVDQTGMPGARTGSVRAGSATEANIAETAGSLRDNAARAQVNQWLSVAGGKMLQRVQATLTIGMWVRLRGMADTELNEFIRRVYPPEVAEQLQGSPKFRQTVQEQFGNERATYLTREELEFQAQVIVVPGSSRLRTLESDRDQFLQAAQLLGSFPALMQSRLLLKHFLMLFDIDDDALIDELQASGQKQIEVEQEKAGRNQGSADVQQNGASGGSLGAGLGALLGG